MKKIYYIVPLLVVLLLTACSSDEPEICNRVSAIGFNTENQTTRAGNADSAPLLGDRFVVFGQKDDDTNVFGDNGYVVTYGTNDWTYDSPP